MIDPRRFPVETNAQAAEIAAVLLGRQDFVGWTITDQGVKLRFTITRVQEVPAPEEVQPEMALPAEVTDPALAAVLENEVVPDEPLFDPPVPPAKVVPVTTGARPSQPGRLGPN